MRVWEIGMVAALAAFVLWPSMTGQPRRPFGWIPVLVAVSALLMHVRAEVIRWQLYPIYGLVAIVAVATGWEILSPSPESPDRPPGRLAQLGKALAAVLGLAVLSLPAIVLPIIDVAAPPTPIGTIVVHSTSDDRIERYGPEPGGPRQIALQIWYPSVPTEQERAPFVDDFDDFAPATSRYLGLPPFALDHLRQAKLNGVLDAPPAPAEQPYPVIIYSHGWAGFRTVAFPQAEALASNGYVVVAIDHTYGALGTTIDDGATFAPLDPAALPDRDTVGDDAYEEASAALVETYRLDIEQAVTVLEDLAAGSSGGGLLAGHVDLTRIGVFGHSTGGGAAIAYCAGDDRCSAVYGLDPWVEPVDDAVLVAGLDLPMAAIRSEAWLAEPNELPLEALWAASSQAAPLVCITGTSHRDFTLLPRLSPAARFLGIGGQLDPLRSSELVETQLVSFFDAYLKGTGTGQAGLDAPEIRGCGLVASGG